MKRNFTKVIGLFVFSTVFAATLSSCGNKSDNKDNSTTSENTTVTTTENSTTTTQSETEETSAQVTTADTSKTEITEKSDIKIADLSSFYNSPNAITISARYNKFNVKKYEIGADSFQGDIDIIDNGSYYLLGVDKIKYSFGVENMINFCNKATNKNVYKKKNGQRFYKIRTGKNKLKCMGEYFTMTSYSENENGRATIKFKGEDGKTYYSYNIMSGKLDKFTGKMHSRLVTEEGKDLYKEIKFDNKTYIKIPYDKAVNTKIKEYVNSSPDMDSGNPHGLLYNIQYDEKGNIVKLNSLTD